MRNDDTDTFRSKAGWAFAVLIVVIIVVLGGLGMFFGQLTPLLGKINQLRKRPSQPRPAQSHTPPYPNQPQWIEQQPLMLADNAQRAQRTQLPEDVPQLIDGNEGELRWYL